MKPKQAYIVLFSLNCPFLSLQQSIMELPSSIIINRATNHSSIITVSLSKIWVIIINRSSIITTSASIFSSLFCDLRETMVQIWVWVTLILGFYNGLDIKSNSDFEMGLRCFEFRVCTCFKSRWYLLKKRSNSEPKLHCYNQFRTLVNRRQIAILSNFSNFM